MSFNLTANDVSAHVLEYELSEHTRETVAPWLSAAEAFKADPAKAVYPSK